MFNSYALPSPHQKKAATCFVAFSGLHGTDTSTMANLEVSV